MSRIHLDKYKLSISINSSGRKVVYDIVRKKEIPYTPEEDVRQKFIQYIIKDLKVPEYMIDEEISMRYYHFDSKRRPDILILKKSKDTGDTVPMVVIECKKRGTIINDTIIEQTIFYAENLKCEFAVITDGEYIDIIHYINTDEFFPICFILRYSSRPFTSIIFAHKDYDFIIFLFRSIHCTIVCIYYIRVCLRMCSTIYIRRTIS